ncbi:MAG: PVC-type heme-binding CxxCH protein, partial [Planctomycetota bacterium]|nr:PVC-type heme-binding CxxCH protein [Planctomycetota bacterium]
MNKSRSRITALLFLSAVLLPASRGAAQAPYSVAPPEKDNTPAAQLKSFTIDKRFEVNLFADETMGIANPICFRWDAGGRLWVLCTWAYPQLRPGEPADDKLMLLEDTTGDGRADRVSTFADGLNMPTGFALGHGGAYIGNGPDLIHVRDTDGDGKADRKEVLFSGFGTGDTHQNINSFAWTPGGELLFCQGLHCFSRVQTPWGIRRLDEHGSWRLRPLRRQLHSYRRSSGGGNPWGYAFGDWGEPFIKSNGGGISEFLPSMVHTDHITGGYWGGAMQIGATKIKSMVTEIVDSPHLPDDLQGDFLIAGYFARNIARLRPSADGAGHKLKTLAPLLTSTHSAFRPVDLNVGPDGAIYVADWFNPIIGHYQASFRHPDRDKKRGRIWRISARGRPLDKPPALATMTAAELCKQLAAPTRWVSQQAKLRLMDLPKAEALAATRNWVKSLDAGDPELEHKLYEAIGVFESHEEVNRPLLGRLLNAKDHRARAYATRVLGRWHDRLDKPLALLKQRA